MINLKPCPDCGHDGNESLRIKQVYRGQRNSYYIGYCGKCGGNEIGFSVENGCPSKQMLDFAHKRWNEGSVNIFDLMRSIDIAYNALDRLADPSEDRFKDVTERCLYASTGRQFVAGEARKGGHEVCEATRS